MSEYYIIDNWYENPDEIRKEAVERLKLNPVKGTEKVKDSGLPAYPGYRTQPSLKNLLENKEKIEKFLNKKVDPQKWVYTFTCDFSEDTSLIYYDMESFRMKVIGTDIIFDHINTVSNGSFQYCPKDSHTWVHTDKRCKYAALVYLNPDPDPRCGTGLYRHKETGKTTELIEEDFPIEQKLDFKYWEEIEYCENVYNRCFLYKSDQFHTATGYFGTTPEDSRLTQTFFFHLLD
jgi:hypothetical protein